MKVLLINGSPKDNGNTARSLEEMIKVFHEEGVETEIIHVGNKDIRGCCACQTCYKTAHCTFDDMNCRLFSKKKYLLDVRSEWKRLQRCSFLTFSLRYWF